MFDVYICDSEELLESGSRQITEVLKEEGCTVNIILKSSNPQFMLEECWESEGVGLFFINAEINSSISGIQFAKYIRKLRPNSYIIFGAIHAEYAIAALESRTGALGCVLRGDDVQERNKLRECIQSVVEWEKNTMRRNMETAVLKLDVSLKVKLSNIIYIEAADKHKVTICTTDGMEETRMRLKDITLHLDSRFYRYNRSLILNIDHIDIDKTMREKVLLLEDGRQLYVDDAMSEHLKMKKSEILKRQSLSFPS